LFGDKWLKPLHFDDGGMKELHSTCELNQMILGSRIGFDSINPTNLEILNNSRFLQATI